MAVLDATALRPRLRGVSHAVAAVVALPAGGWLIGRAPTAGLRTATAGYALTLVAIFSVSGAYHCGRWMVAARRRMKALDHVTIFCFIAGSYGPLALLVLSPTAATVWLGALWVAAGLGGRVKLRALDRLGGSADVWYGACTWWALLIAPALVSALSPPQLGLLFGGLALYSLGAACLGLRRPNPWPGTYGYHEVAHLLSVVGAACHFALYAELFR